VITAAEICLLTSLFVGRHEGLGLTQSRHDFLCSQAGIIVSASEQFEEIDPLLLVSLIHQESSWNPEVGCNPSFCGITQIGWRAYQDVTGHLDSKTIFKSELLNPEKAIFVGAAYLAQRIQRHGSLRMGLAAYNGGDSNPQFWYADDILENHQYLLELKKLLPTPRIPYSIREENDENFLNLYCFFFLFIFGHFLLYHLNQMRIKKY